MAKQGMKRIDRTHTKPKNDMPLVPEIQAKAKHGKEHENSIIKSQKFYLNKPHSEQITISSAYDAVDNDLARDNIANHLSAADLQDL